MTEVQAYITLRGSRLSMEDKKRILVEAGAEREDGELEMKRVSAAIRMLGSSFFQEYTSGKRDKNLRTYDHSVASVASRVIGRQNALPVETRPAVIRTRFQLPW